MKNPLRVFLVGFAVLLCAQPAEARFGKKGSKQASTTREAKSVGSSDSQESANNAGSAVSPARSNGRSYGRRSRYGYWSGVFLPSVSVGVGYAAARPQVIVSEPVEEALQQEPEPEGVRFSAGLEGQGFRGGATVGALLGLEGERWGITASAQNIAALAEDGSGRFDHLQVATAHLTFAFLTGRYGRLRIEGGADAVFAPNLIVIGPTGGFSGTVWIGGPFALEGSVMVTPWPYRQFDGKLGVALGLGPFGLRAGFRAQVLDDRGLVDGVIHTDTFLGPYVGVSLVF